MNEYIYVIECSKGSYEDAVNWIIGVYADKTEADALAKQINLNYEIIKSNEPNHEDRNKYNTFWVHYNFYGEDFYNAQVITFNANFSDYTYRDPYDAY